MNQDASGVAPDPTAEGAPRRPADPSPVERTLALLPALSAVNGPPVRAAGSETAVVPAEPLSALPSTPLLSALIEDGAARPVITAPARVEWSEVASLQTPIVQARGVGVKYWTLEGPDARLFHLDRDTAALTWQGPGQPDAEKPWSATGKPFYELRWVAHGTTGTVQQQPLQVALTDQAEPPDWITADHYVRSATRSGSTDPQDGMASLLANDLIGVGNYQQPAYFREASWVPMNWDDASRPVGQAVQLTFAFQGPTAFSTFHGKVLPDGEVYQFTDREKTAIRTMIRSVSTFSGLNLTEMTGTNALKKAEEGGADIRIFRGDSAWMGPTPEIAAFAVQPYHWDSRQSDIYGNIHLIADAPGMPPKGSAYTSTFGWEHRAFSHELFHALGLDHPFNSLPDRAGVAAFNEPDTAKRLPNRLGQTTGGGHDTPLTDSFPETVMTYHKPARPLDAWKGVTIQDNQPWAAGVQDIAALQHLYGVNTTWEAGNNTYTFDNITPAFRTIWDAGGLDAIVQTGKRDAVIDLRGGEHLSRVGYMPGPTVDLGPDSFPTPSASGVAQLVLMGGKAGSAPTQTIARLTPAANGHFKWVSDADLDITALTLIRQDSAGREIDRMTVPWKPLAEAERFNVGIAYGVTIENAVGGDGNDVIHGNDAANLIRTGNGNNTVHGSRGPDTVQLGSSLSGRDQVIYTDLDDFQGDTLQRLGSSDRIVFSGVTGLTRGQFEWQPGSNGSGLLVHRDGADVHSAWVTPLVAANGFDPLQLLQIQA